MDLIDIVCHPAAAQYRFFPTAHRTFSQIDHSLGHKTSLSKYKNIEIIPCILSNHNGVKLELTSKRNYRKYSNTWRMNNALLNDQWITEEIRNRKVPGIQ
jgi:hypothetical protein